MKIMALMTAMTKQSSMPESYPTSVAPPRKGEIWAVGESYVPLLPLWPVPMAPVPVAPAAPTSLLLALLGVADKVVGWAAPVSDGWKVMPAEELAAGDPPAL
jgi:hypothetical protein